ncbi:MAG: LysE family translocator [Microbacterium sp.]|nr:LysE family translocator [Microbacterium sp.]
MVVVESGGVSRREAGGLAGSDDDLPGGAVVDVVVDPDLVLQARHLDDGFRGERMVSGQDDEEVLDDQLMPVVPVDESRRQVDRFVPDVDVRRSATATVVGLVEADLERELRVPFAQDLGHGRNPCLGGRREAGDREVLGLSVTEVDDRAVEPVQFVDRAASTVGQVEGGGGRVSIGEYLGFVAVALVLAVTPGPDTLLSLRYAVTRRPWGIAAASGSTLAIFVWAGLTAVGVAAVVQTSDLIYRVLCAASGVYLMFLGGRAVLRARRHEASAVNDRGRPASGAASSRRSGAANAFVAGILTSLSNPKTGLFFLALFPGYTPPGAHPLFVVVVLGGTVAAVVYIYLAGLVLVADAANRWLARPRVSGAIELLSGLVMIGLGVFTFIPALLPAT